MSTIQVQDTAADNVMVNHNSNSKTSSNSNCPKPSVETRQLQCQPNTNSTANWSSMSNANSKSTTTPTPTKAFESNKNTTSSTDSSSCNDVCSRNSEMNSNSCSSGSGDIDMDDESLDITREFFEAAKDLKLGELLHDSSFGLFEAMSAIEMMDPKMDAGMICNKGKRAIMNFDQSIEAGKLQLKDIKYDELIGNIDTTLCCLVTWLEGHSLAQTIFTNLYLHKPSNIEDKYLKAFCVGILKQVDVIEECISKAGIFEEEDFQSSVYGYNLASQFSDSKSASMLRDCEEDIIKQLKVKQLKSQTNNNNNNFNNINNQPSQNEVVELQSLDIDYLNAIFARLKFTRLFHALLLHLWKRENILEECPKLLSNCQESLSIIQKTVNLGLQRKQYEPDEFMFGFEPLVNQRLLPPTFPRSTRIIDISDTFNFFDGFLQRIKIIIKVVSLPNFHAVIEFFHSFSESQPCVLSRSILQLLYGPMRFKKPSKDDMIEQMKESVRTFISPPILSSKSITSQNKEIVECVDMFFDRCAAPFASLLISQGHNRARRRDKIAHLLEDFANLQLETERIDAYIHQQCLKIDGIYQHGNCFGNWILYHITKIMIRYVLTGFELELYSIHELSYIYWYLYEFLYGWLLSSLSRADTYVTEQENSIIEKLGKKGAKAKAKGNNRKTKAYTKEVCMIQAEQYLAGGYFKAIMGLINDKRIPMPHKEFDNESVRYRHRFEAFKSIRTPSPVHYLQYKSIADLSSIQASSTLYLASSKSFQQAKQYLEAIPSPVDKEVQDLLKIAKTNFIVVKLLASGHTKGSDVPPVFDFSTHMHFPIINLNAK